MSREIAIANGATLGSPEVEEFLFQLNRDVGEMLQREGVIGVNFVQNMTGESPFANRYYGNINNVQDLPPNIKLYHGHPEDVAQHDQYKFDRESSLYQKISVLEVYGKDPYTLHDELLSSGERTEQEATGFDLGHLLGIIQTSQIIPKIVRQPEKFAKAPTTKRWIPRTFTRKPHVYIEI